MARLKRRSPKFKAKKKKPTRPPRLTAKMKKMEGTSAQARATTVLFIPELLESILLQLDSAHFSPSPSVCAVHGEILMSGHPLFSKPCFFRPLNLRRRCMTFSLLSCFRQFYLSTINTLSLRLRSSRSRGKQTTNFTAELDVSTLDLGKNPHKRPAYLCKEASWHCMLIQQPPARSFSTIRHKRSMSLTHMLLALMALQCLR